MIEPNDNTAKAYMEMSSEALRVMNNERANSLRWAVSSCYYAMYYALYSVLQRIGVKSEIHSCTIELMRFVLKDLYSEKDHNLINKAFECRNSVQYYADRIVDKSDSNYIFENCPVFISKSKTILAKLNQDDINKIRSIIKKETEYR